ncbi:MAG: hypothetical protein KEFWMYNX_000136, partial [Candidatus Fervidibacter sp.]
MGRAGWLVLLIAMVSVAPAMQETEKEPPQTQLLRLDGSVRGIIIGLNRATLAILSAQQVVTYLHLPIDKLPNWVRTGVAVTVLYRVNENGEFWAEQISPPSPTEPQEPSPTTPKIVIVPLESLIKT